MGICSSSNAGRKTSKKSKIDLESLTKFLTDDQQKFFDAIKHNDVEGMQEMIRRKRSLLEARMKGNVSPVMYAAKYSNLEVLRILVEQYKCDLWELDEYQEVGAYSYACLHVEDSIENVKYLHNKNPMLVKHKNWHNTTTLHAASEDGKLEIVKFLVNEAKLDIYEVDKDGDNAFMCALAGSNLSVMKFFEEIDPEIVKTTNQHGENALFYACIKNLDHDYFLYLYETVKLDNTIVCKSVEGTNNHSDYLGYNLAMAAAYGNSIEKLKYIYERNPESLKVTINPDDNFSSYLPGVSIVRASNEGTADMNFSNNRRQKNISNLEVIRFLAEECGIDIHQDQFNQRLKTTEKNAETYFQLNYVFDPATVDYYISNDATLMDFFNSEEFADTYFYRVLSNDYVLMKHFVDSGYINFRKMYDNGKPLFYWAARSANLRVMEYLYDLDQHLVGSVGDELIAAIDNPDVSLNTVKFLMETCGLQKQIMAKREEGKSAFMIACASCDVQIIDYLYQKNPKMAILRDDNNFSALHYACYFGNFPAVKYLLKVTKLQPSELSKKPEVKNCFDWAVVQGYLDIAKYIYDKTPTIANATRCDDFGLNTLHSAFDPEQTEPLSNEKRMATLKFFAEYIHYNVQQPSAAGFTVFDELCLKKGNIDLIKYLATKYKNIQHVGKSKTGISPLHFASAHSDLTTVEYLVDKLKMDPKDKSSKNGSNCFLHASMFHRKEITEFYLKKDPSLKDSTSDNDLNAAFLAVDADHDFYKFLIEEGQVDHTYENKDGFTTFTFCAWKGTFQNLKYLHEKSPELHKIRSDDDMDALFFVTSVEKAEFLIETVGMDPRRKGGKYYPIQKAIMMERDLDVVRYLYEKAPEILTKKLAIFEDKPDEVLTPIQIAFWCTKDDLDTPDVDEKLEMMNCIVDLLKDDLSSIFKIEETCVICMSNPAVHGFAVCQHVALCKKCFKKQTYESCPVCRENIPGRSTCSKVTIENGKVEFSEYTNKNLGKEIENAFQIAIREAIARNLVRVVIER